MPEPVAPSVTLTWAPQGACRCRCSDTAANAALGSASGAMRTLTFARADGAKVFDASATEVASMPSTVAVGLVQRRPAIEPPPSSWTPGSTPASARNRSSG